MSPSPDSWARLRALFEAGLEVPAAGREAWLSTEIEEPDVRAEVARLLQGHEAEGPFDELTGALSAVSAQDVAEVPVPVVLGPYRIEDLLGEGGTARVFAARRDGDASAPRVAIKVLRAEADTVRVRRRFLAEREIVAGLDHPGIARFLDAGFTPEGAPWLVTEYVDGRPIDRHAKEEGLDADACIALVLSACDAVEAAHRMGVVHRDLKPANVLVDVDGRARLLDFGIAKVLEGAVFEQLHRNTSAGVRLLTVRYASPEQLLGGEITAASDVYQLGLLFTRLLTGRLPRTATKFEDGGAVEIPSVSERGEGRGAGPGMPGALVPVIARALAPRAAERFPSAGALAAAVRSAMSERDARGSGEPGRLRRWLGFIRS